MKSLGARASEVEVHSLAIDTSVLGVDLASVEVL